VNNNFPNINVICTNYDIVPQGILKSFIQNSLINDSEIYPIFVAYEYEVRIIYLQLFYNKM